MKLSIILSVTIIMSLGCCKVAEPLKLERMNFNSNVLKIQGYYFHKKINELTSFILYKNGVIYFSSFLAKDLIEADSFLFNYIEQAKKLQYVWGVFKVNNNEISIERWLSGNGGPYPTQLLIGEIVNDTTIAISGLRGTLYKNEIDTFRFRYLAIKPDSTNMFIK